MKRVIDAHTHVTEDGRWFNTSYDASLARLFNEMEKAKLDKVILLPVSPYISNEFVYRICKEFPNEIIGFASVEPLKVKAIEELEKAITKYELRGLKLHPRFQMFRPNDGRLYKLYKKVEELGIPIMFDCILNRPTPLRDQLPILYDDVANLIPDTPIILAHMGGFKFLEVLAVANKNKNIYVDTSLTLEYFYRTPFQEQVRFVLEKIGYDRVIYGSDFPERSLVATLISAKKILIEFGVSNENLYKIFYKNILRLINK